MATSDYVPTDWHRYDLCPPCDGLDRQPWDPRSGSFERWISQQGLIVWLGRHHLPTPHERT